MMDNLTDLLIGYKVGECPLGVLCDRLEELNYQDISSFIKLLGVDTVASGRVNPGYVAVVHCPRTMWTIRWTPFDRLEFTVKEDAEKALRSSIVVYIQEAIGNG